MKLPAAAQLSKVRSNQQATEVKLSTESRSRKQKELHSTCLLEKVITCTCKEVEKEALAGASNIDCRMKSTSMLEQKGCDEEKTE